MQNTPGWSFYEKQLDYIFAGDVDGLIDNHYTEDAQLIGADLIVTGRPALKEHFRGYLKRLGKLTVKSTGQFKESDDSIYLEADVVTDLGPAVVYDAWVLKDGKISHHFTGVK